ncbi:Peptidase [Nitrospira japonica]|uniref:Peptidase n=1 Tax=Nitrospira japonica TaxID=1325564 RepID=A0A1W1I6V7_9BACT|nr:PepSY-associated TM helix domain-containing protein [Nitrospira japonica]SLM48599.1 Peptidase [Nitrospira japonica]
MTIVAFKKWYVVHKWTSLVCTLFLLLLCLTGLPLVFRDELSVWLGEAVEPPEQVVATKSVTLQALVDDAQRRRPSDAVQFLTLDDEHPAWFVSLGASPAAIDSSGIYMYDTRTGDFLHAVPTNTGVTNFFFKLHTELFAGLPGMLFLGSMGLLFLGSTVSGVVVYGPFMRKLAFGTIRQERHLRLTWLDLHNLLGITTLLWALVVGVTGVVNTLERPLLGYWQQTELAGMLAPWSGKPAPRTLLPVDRVIEAAQAAAPDLVPRFVGFPGTVIATPYHYVVFMRGQNPLTSRLLTPFLFDAETAQLADTRSLPWYLTVLVLSQPLHFGDYGGMPLKIIWGMLDLLIIIVLVSGLYLWWRKRPFALEHVVDDGESKARHGFDRVVPR